MSKRLNTITDWPALAKQAHYHVAELARVLGVSMRSFEDYFKVNRQVSPHAYLAQLRIREIQQRARPGEQGQAIHQQVASAHFSSFSRALRRDSGRS